MTRHQCKWILIGLLVTFIDFRLESFNLVPDLVGWIIIMVQLSDAQDKYLSYGTARNISIILLALSIPDLFIEMNVYPFGEFYFLLTLGSMFLYLLFIWKLLEGIALQLEAQNWVQQSQSIWSFRKIYAIFNVIIICLTAFTGLIPGGERLAYSIWWIPIIAGFVLQIFLYVKLFDTRKIIEEDNIIATT